MFTSAYIHKHTDTCLYADCVYMPTDMYMCMYMYTCGTNIDMHAYSSADMHAYAHIFTCTYVPVCIHLHTSALRHTYVGR